MLITHVLLMSYYREKLHNLSSLNLWPSYSPGLNPDDHSMRGILHEKVHETRITDLDLLTTPLMNGSSLAHSVLSHHHYHHHLI